MTGGFQGFDLFFVLTNGGPYGATEIPTTYLVKTVFRNAEVGYGSAMAVILTAIVLGVGLAYQRLQQRRAAEAVTARARRRGARGRGRSSAAPRPTAGRRTARRHRRILRLLGASGCWRWCSSSR